MIWFVLRLQLKTMTAFLSSWPVWVLRRGILAVLTNSGPGLGHLPRASAGLLWAPAPGCSASPGAWFPAEHLGREELFIPWKLIVFGQVWRTILRIDLITSKRPHLLIPFHQRVGFQHMNLGWHRHSVHNNSVLQTRTLGTMFRHSGKGFSNINWSLLSTLNESGMSSVLLFSKWKVIAIMFPKSPGLVTPSICHSGHGANPELEHQSPSLVEFEGCCLTSITFVFPFI